MDKKEIFEEQFHLEKKNYLKKLDFIDWYRFYYIIKEVINSEPENILEIGEGSGVVKNCLSPLVKEYKTLDVNKNLNPDFLSDIKDFKNELKGKFQCIIAADVLEHLPFFDFGKSVRNIYDYLSEGGEAIITIPHRRSHFLFMTPIQKPHVFTVPTGFLSPGAFYRRFIKRRIWIDPNHYWEIGDGKVKKKDVESVFEKVGFKINDFKKLIYVDFWVLKK